MNSFLEACFFCAVPVVFAFFFWYLGFKDGISEHKKQVDRK